MFRQANEFKYTATTGQTYIIYLLKSWSATDKENDYIVKYQIRAPDRDFVWYGRISKERFLSDTKGEAEELESLSEEEFTQRLENHLKKLFVYVMKKALDKGFAGSNTEFVFYKNPPISKKTWGE